MIHYSLQCGQSHAFDGWFPDSASFDRQVALALVRCPRCGDTGVSRALMAPAIARARLPAPPRAAMPEVPPEVTPVAPAVPSGERMPDHVRAALQRVRAEIERTCVYVGAEFADEALRIHKGDVAARPIYGEATPEQADALLDEGVEIARIPWVPRADG